MPPEMDDNDIPSPDGFGFGDAGAEKLADVMGAASDAMRALGARALDVFAVGLESVVGQRPGVRVSDFASTAFEAVTDAFEGLDTVAIEVRFALNETEAHPVALLIAADDLGRLLSTDLSLEQLADDDFARRQAELISTNVRELLDLTGLMLFIDELAGGEATLGTVRIGGVAEAMASLQSGAQGAPAVRFDLVLTLNDGTELQATLIVPGSLIARLAETLAGPTAPRVDPAPRPESVQPRAMSEGNAGVAGSPAVPGGVSSRMADPEVPVHPARFPQLNIPEGISAAQQQVDLILDVPLRVSVELGRSSMTIEEVLALGPGSVLELNKLAGEPVDVLVNDRLIARGEVVVVDENFGVRVTEVVSPRTRATALAR